MPDRLDIHRIRPAEFLALLAGVALFTDLFLPWYTFHSGRLSAWSALGVIDLLLALSALLAMALFAAVLLQRTPAPAITLGVCLVPVALAAVLSAVYRLLDPPGDALSTCYGARAGMLTAALVLVAAWWSIADERPARGVPVDGARR